MSMIRLPQLALPAPELAPRLLGCEFEVGDRRAVILETEAYQGEEDRGCHASKGRTPRTATLYREAGTLYCYLCYGIHILTNIVCDQEGVPAAVLLRGMALDGLPLHRSNGPGKLSARLGLKREHDSQLLGTRFRLFGTLDPPSRTLHCSGPRVGIAYAGSRWGNKAWRHWLSEWRGERYPAVKQADYRDAAE